MSTFVLDNTFVSIDGNDVSDHVKSAGLNYSADEVDNTHMGDLTHLMLGGLKDWSIDIEISQDFASSQIDSIIFPLVGTIIPVILRPTAGAVSATNPNYVGQALLTTYNPFSGSVGDLAGTTINLKAAGTLTREIS